MAEDHSKSGSRWDVLTQTGAGTRMGELLRRYWWPVAGASEFDEPGTRPVRLLGEDLVLYKDLGGRFGLLDRHCRHRRADLSYGYVEQCGMRCNYHRLALQFRRRVPGASLRGHGAPGAAIAR